MQNSGLSVPFPKCNNLFPANRSVFLHSSCSGLKVPTLSRIKVRKMRLEFSLQENAIGKYIFTTNEVMQRSFYRTFEATP